MTFEEWFHKEYEPADLQINRCAERKEGLHIPATVYLEDLKKAFEAGQKELEKENAELKDKLNNLASVADVRLGMWQKYEKENAELKKESNNLFLEGAKRVEELEAQIEKMKCCFNCKHSRTEYEHCRTDKHEKWEVKEND